MNELLINGIYNNSIKTILNGIPEEDINLVMASYKSYLFDNYADTLDENDNIEQVIAIYSTMEIKKWSKKSLQEKKAILLMDDSFKKLQSLSDIAYKHASRKLGHIISNMEYQSSLTEEQVNNYINEMKILFESVKEYNIPMAKIYLSEGIQDFLYASQLSNDMSLRVSRLK